MKLFVTNDWDDKIYLSAHVSTREELSKMIGGTTFLLSGKRYTIYDVRAEAESSHAAGGALLGGMIGLLGGFLGVVAGILIGGLISAIPDSEEASEIVSFNVSSL